MKGPSKILCAIGAALALAFSALQGGAQQAQQPPAQLQLKPASPSAIAAANALLTAKNANQVWANAVPNIIQRVKDQLLANNLSYQKDLNEVAVTEAQAITGREKQIGETLDNIYANDFTEKEMKDLTAFYKSPLGQKLLAQDPKTDQTVIGFLNQWAQAFSQTVAADFRAAMQKRGKPLGG